MVVNKAINLDNPKSFDYFKKIMFTNAKYRYIVYGTSYKFLVFVGGKSFRNLKNPDKQIIKKRIKQELSKINKNLIKKLYNKKLSIRLELFLTESYMRRVDLDNVAKAVLDIMNKIAFEDDKQVYHLDAIKSKATKGAIGMNIREIKATRLKFA